MRNSRLFLSVIFFTLCGLAVGFADGPHNNEFKTEGNIESIGPDSLMVNNFVFDVDSTTSVSAENDSSFLYADLKPADYVKVEGYAKNDSSGGYFATKIELREKGHHDMHEIKTRGLISAIYDSSFDVNGYTFWVDNNTVFKGHDDSLLAFADFAVDMNVEVEAYKDSLGNYVAKKVKLDDGSDQNDHEEFDFSGVVDSLAADGFAMSQRFFFVDSLTKFKISHDQSASFSDLTVGSEIELEALQLSDGSFYAKKVELRDQSQAYLELTGAIDSVGFDFIVVLDYMVKVDSTTRISGRNKTPLTLADLQKGQRVKVRGVETSPNVVAANRIKVYEFHSNKDHFKGTVVAIGADYLQVDQRTFFVDSLTQYRDSLGQRSSLAAFSVGDYVKVEARSNADGSWYAREVKQKEQHRSEVEFSGTIDSLFIDGIRVAGNIFWLDSLTQVYDLQDYPMSADSLGMGDVVEVTAQVLADGSFRALRIKQESRPDLITVDGVVDAVSSNSVWISGPEFQLSQRSVVLDQNYAPTANSNLQPGDAVTLWAVPGNSATPIVIQIKLNTTSVTGLARGELRTGIVRDFVLNQNYPNPFNPSTTIAFKINLNGYHKVRLSIYDATGRLINTLYDGLLERGAYNFVWGARNNFGQDVASGLYFYRLSVGTQAKTARMLLLR